jgi:hypothetical protein
LTKDVLLAKGDIIAAVLLFSLLARIAGGTDSIDVSDTIALVVVA